MFVNKYRERVLQTRYQKAKSIIANAYNLMMAKEEVTDVTALGFMDCKDSKCYSDYHSRYFHILADSANGLDIDTLPLQYKKNSASLTFIPSAYADDEYSDFKWKDVPYVFAVPEGYIFGVMKDEDSNSFSIVTDVSSNYANPNTVMEDLYKFRVIASSRIVDVSEELNGNDDAGYVCDESCFNTGGSKGDDKCPKLPMNYYYRDMNGKCMECEGTMGYREENCKSPNDYK